MHHLRSVKDVRIKIRMGESTYEEREGAFRRKQVPLCKYHHSLYHGELFAYEINTIRGYEGNTPVGLISFNPKRGNEKSVISKADESTKQRVGQVRGTLKISVIDEKSKDSPH